MWQGRYGLAVAAARVVAILSRRMGHGGTALPGLAAKRVAPDVLARIAGELGAVALISGTNGKTTTSHLVTHILERGGRYVIANRSGANLQQGLAAALVAAAGFDGRLRRPDAIGVFEVDEAALGSVASDIPVSLLVLLNLFRDQLDRFGETDAIIHHWESLVAGLPASSVVVYCADDPRLERLVAKRPGPSTSFGLSRPDNPSHDDSLTVDVATCPSCDGPLARSWTTIGHLGSFACHRCGFRRIEPDVRVRVLADRGVHGQTLGVRMGPEPTERVVDVRLPGMANAYNYAAAVAVAVSIGIPVESAVEALADAGPAFGRFEDLEMDGRRVVLSLGKNPASLSELTNVALESDVSAVLFAFNDGFADGQDVSWLWDVDVSRLLDGRPFAVAGDRATDFMLRLKYSGADDGPTGLPGGYVATASAPLSALDSIVASTPHGSTVLVVATYTALMKLRQGLVARSLLPDHPR